MNDLRAAANVSSRLEAYGRRFGTTFSTINRTYLDSEIPAILKVVEEGFTVPLPSLHEVLVVPRARVFRDRLERLAQLPSTLSSHAPYQIATFSFSRRASLPAELTVLAKLLVAARQANALLNPSRNHPRCRRRPPPCRCLRPPPPHHPPQRQQPRGSIAWSRRWCVPSGSSSCWP